MRRSAPLPPRDVMLGTALLAGGALAMAVLVSSLSTPRDFKVRVAAVDAKADRAAALVRTASPGPYGPEAICTGDPAREAQALQDAVTGFAAQNVLTVDSLEARPEPAPEVSARLTPVRLRATMTGSYEGAVGLLAVLGRRNPQLFVDSFDLMPKTANVTLSLSGRVFCSA